MLFASIPRNYYRYVTNGRLYNSGKLLLNAVRDSRCLSTSQPVANLTTSSTVATPVTARTSSSPDDLRLIFDDSTTWKQHQQLAPLSNTVQPTGILEHPHFVDADGFDYAAQQAIQRAQIIVERICNAPQNGIEEMQRVVKNLDRLSDTLCIVIDLAEFLRNAHPDPLLLDAANKAYTDLCTYMNTLNTDTRIHKVNKIKVQLWRLTEIFILIRY